MLVRDLLHKPPFTVREDSTLCQAACLMWEHDCGCVPVVDAAGRPIAMLTDRDLCMAAYLNGQTLAQMPVGRAMSKQLWTCSAAASLADALAVLRQHQVHRLAVVDEQGVLVGVVSLSDLALAAGREPRQRELGDAVLATLVAVKRPRGAEPRAEPAVVLQPAPRRARPAPAGRRKKAGKS